MNKLILAGVLAGTLAACAAQPPEAQLALACNSIAAGYRTASAYLAQGKMTAASVQTLIDLEPKVEAICDPAKPPLDLAAALQEAQDYLNQVTLANAGVK